MTWLIAIIACLVLSCGRLAPFETPFTESGAVILYQPKTITGEPFIVRDGDLWRMYFFRSSNIGQSLGDYTATSKFLTGPWENVQQITTDAHKIAPIVNEVGAISTINGLYYALSVKFTGGNVATYTGKQIHLYSSSKLEGPWDDQGVVISNEGLANADAPYAFVYQNKLYLSYMRQGLDGVYSNVLTINHDLNPKGPFDSTNIAIHIQPDTYHSGWIGGAQYRLIDNLWVILFNGANRFPDHIGSEPAPSRFGFATTKTLKQLPIQYQEPAVYSNMLNLWRPHMVEDNGQWYIFYNTGDESGEEWITYAKGD